MYNPAQKVFHFTPAKWMNNRPSGYYAICDYIEHDLAAKFTNYINFKYPDKRPALSQILLDFHLFMGKVFVTEEKES